MENRRKLPAGIQDFEDLRTNGNLYVDKTAYVYQLANFGKHYFLGRPRRFGKSLLLSTLEIVLRSFRFKRFCFPVENDLICRFKKS